MSGKKGQNLSPCEIKAGFNFGKARSSVRGALLLRKLSAQHASSNGSEPPSPSSTSGTLGRWFRDLRPGSKNSQQQQQQQQVSQTPARTNPVYHSEGKGMRKRRKADRRRLSFNEREDSVTSQDKCQDNKGVDTKAVNSTLTRSATPDGKTNCSQLSVSTDIPSSPRPMSRSTPNLQPILSYLPQQAAPQQPLKSPDGPSRSESTTSLPVSSSASSGLSSWGSTQDASRAGWEQAPTPPVRDASSLKSLRYGPGHEKFPSWPVPAAADTLPAVRECCHATGGSHRSKSWTEHTDYPKENPSHYYTRPYMRRQVSCSSSTSPFTLKTVLERSEAAMMFAEPPEPRRRHLPNLDREGKPIGDLRYLAPSPPERDSPGQKAEPQVPHLTQAEVEEYARTYDAALLRQQSSEFLSAPMHQSQGSYAQSEGYHSYVSSTDSTTTPFLDRLRQDSAGCPHHGWEDEDVERDTDTLNKWRGSLSDMSVTSSSLGMSSRQLIAHSSRVQTPQRHMSESVLYLAPQQQQTSSHGAHWPSRVQRNNALNSSRTSAHALNSSLSVAERVHELERQSLSVSTSSLASSGRSSTRVTDPAALKAFQKRALLSYYERQQQQQWRSEPHLSPPPAPPRTSASDCWKRHEPQMAVPMTRDMSDKHLPCDSEVLSIKKPNVSPQNLSPNHEKPLHIRESSITDGSKTTIHHCRESSITDKSSKRETSVVRRNSHSSNSSLSSSELPTSPIRKHRQELPTNKKQLNGNSPIKNLPSPTDTSSDLLGPLIVGPSISLDDWVPERPPKKPHLRSTSFQQFPTTRLRLVPCTLPVTSLSLPAPSGIRRTSSPDPPPPTPPPFMEDEVFNSDLPLPSPPPELTQDWTTMEQGSGHAKSTSNLPGPPSSYLRRNNGSEPPCSMEGSYKHLPTLESLVTPASATTLPVVTPVTTIATATKTTVVNSVAVGVATQATKLLTKTSKLIRDFDVINNDTKTTTTYPIIRTDKNYNNNNLNNYNCDKFTTSPPVKDINNTVKSYVDLNCVATKLAAFEIKEALPIQNNHVNDNHLIGSKLQDNLSTNHITASNNEGSRPVRTHAVSVATQATETRSPLRLESCSSPSSPLTSPPPSPPAINIGPGESPKPVTSTSDAASQTEEDKQQITFLLPSVPIDRPNVTLKAPSPSIEVTSPSPTPSTTSSSRVALREEEECEQLSRVLASQLPPSDRLHNILAPVSEHKKVTDYVSGLFRLDIRPRPSSRLSNQSSGQGSCDQSTTNHRSTSPIESPPPSPSQLNGCVSPSPSEQGGANTSNTSVAAEPLPADSAYFTTSEPKARFLTQYSEDISAPGITASEDLQRKKEELMSRLGRKLDVLREEQLVVAEEAGLNETLGAALQERLKVTAKSQEAAKLALHVEEVGKVTSLLLGLSGRLARAENAIMGLKSCDEKRILEGKRDKLAEQLAEAKQLKASIDRRSCAVSSLLSKSLDSEASADFEHFVHMKASLQVESRELADRVRLGEEQLAALKETLQS